MRDDTKKAIAAIIIVGVALTFVQPLITRHTAETAVAQEIAGIPFISQKRGKS
jgi:hypothetical protein